MFTTSNSRFRPIAACVALACASLVACGDDDDAEGGGEWNADNARFALSSIVSNADTDESSTYVSLLDSLAKQDLDYKQAREFPGNADVWVRDSSIFVSSLDSLTITKYSLEGSKLIEKGKLSFASYDLHDFGFWLNTFVSSEKAYFCNGVKELIVWNPQTMKITGTIELPELEERGGYKAFASYTDRSVQIRDGKLYLPIYWTDDTYFKFTPDSTVAVFDTEQDEFVQWLEAPCPGLDYATAAPNGNLYFSSWIFAPGAAALLDQPATCVAKLASDSSEIKKAFDVRDIAEGRDGGAFRLIGDGRALLSVLHPEHAEDDTDAQDITYGGNWRFWSYDLDGGEASEIDAIDWNAGAAYSAQVDGKPFMLVPSADYASTEVYDLSGSEPVSKIETTGWSMRLFNL